LADVAAKGCDGFITGDVKHDVFISAANAGICVFDGGHYNTENIFCEYMKEKLEEKFEGTEVVIAKSGRDILETLC
jgi:putative NIF3 family GTP cyclohydrolase 1 type 2